MKRRNRAFGFTLIELVASLAIIGILSSLLLVGISAVRESSRQMQCQVNQAQIALAVHNFSLKSGRLPWFAGTDDDWASGPIVELFGELELQDVKRRMRGVILKTPPFQSEAEIPSIVMCPSDGERGTNYRFCAGTGISYQRYLGIDGDANGPIVGDWVPTRFADIQDGLSHTALTSERLIGRGFEEDRRSIMIGPVLRPICADEDFACAKRYLESAWGRSSKLNYGGRDWTSTGWGVSAYSHMLPPNHDLAGLFNRSHIGIQMGIVPPTSNHPAMVIVSMLDGSVRTVSDEVNLSVWQAMATRSGRD